MPQIIFLPHEELCPDGAAVEAEQGEVLEDREQQPAVYFQEFLIAHDVDIVDQRLVDAFGHVELLEEGVIAFLFSVEVVDDGLVEHFFLHKHQHKFCQYFDHRFL